MKRVILILLDGVGVGELPDAEEYNDKGTNTLSNLSKAYGRLCLPTLENLGLGNITDIRGVKPLKQTRGAYGKMAEKSKGKDSTTGHWEIAGIILHKPFPTYPDGFPKEMIKKFENVIGKKTIGGYPASGTEIIKKLGQEHLKTGAPIIYTSADSVFQIAAHKDIIPLDQLYNLCEIARTLFPAIGRVIARPFIGTPHSFKRTTERKDFSLAPPEPTLLDCLKEKELPVTLIGKIDNIFAMKGYTQAIHTRDNKDGRNKILKVMKDQNSGLIFINLIDFDMLWGHRNDVQGFARGMEDFDRWLPSCLEMIKEEDILFITADHGTDPTTPSTDHSREYVPVLAVGPKVKKGINLGTRDSFSDLGATIADYFGITLKNGKSFLDAII